MEELLALKQEVNQLKKAKERAGSNDDRAGVPKEVLTRMKDQIVALKSNQDELR